MASCSKSSKKMGHFLSNVPDNVINTIIKKLSIRKAAQTSVLSKQWRHAWVSLNDLIFNFEFQEQQKYKNGRCNWRKNSRIISSILLHHVGPVHVFCLEVPDDANVDHMTLSQWISFLSKNGVQAIVINNCEDDIYVPSCIFLCIELVQLKLSNFSLNHLPTAGFLGFPKLEHLVLVNIKFSNPNLFRGLMENCTMLVTLELEDWSGMDHVVIHAPNLETLILKGEFKSLFFKNVSSLESISLCLTKMPEQVVSVETIDAINLLAASCQLQAIEFAGHFCKFLAAGDIMKSPRVIFNHVDKLCLSDVDLNDFDVFYYLLAMIERCPYIMKLDISVVSGVNVVGEHILGHDHNYDTKLDHLCEVRIKGMTGSSAELKLIEYLLAVSVVLENLFFNCGEIDIESKFNMSRVLMRFPRASTKASLVCLDK